MVLYTIKNLLPIKDILTLPTGGINNYIKIRKEIVLEKQQRRNSGKWKKIK